MQKKIALILLGLLLSVNIMACGSKEDNIEDENLVSVTESEENQNMGNESEEVAATNTEMETEEVVRIEDTGLIISVTDYPTKRAIVRGVKEGVTDVVIPQKVYYECEEPSNRNEPKSGEYEVTEIGFMGENTEIESIVIPDSVTLISIGAFRNCTSLKEITLPDTVHGIDKQVFMGCTSLESIDLSNMGSINDEAFSGCTNLKEVILSDSLKEIGHAAFMDCVSLEKVEIPESVTRIYTYAFNGCTSLNEVNIPSGIITIEANVFQKCTSLKNIELHEEIGEIEACAFQESGLEYIDATHVGSIGVGAFSGCVNLKEVVLGDTYLENDTFNNCTIEKIHYAGTTYADAWFEYHTPGAELVKYTLE